MGSTISRKRRGGTIILGFGSVALSVGLLTQYVYNYNSIWLSFLGLGLMFLGNFFQFVGRAEERAARNNSLTLR